MNTTAIISFPLPTNVQSGSIASTVNNIACVAGGRGGGGVGGGYILAAKKLGRRPAEIFSGFRRLFFASPPQKVTSHEQHRL